MALIKCKECNHGISKSAKVCPSCGSKNKQTNFLTKFVLGLIAFIAIVNIPACYISFQENKVKAGTTTQAKSTEEKKISAMTPSQKLDAERIEKEKLLRAVENYKIDEGLVWDYSEYEDKMGRGKTKYATVKSLNKFEFSFPYKNPQRATLQLRKNPEYGNNVILIIERGQFICGISSCTVQAKFGEGKAIKYSSSKPADNSTDALFISDPSSFVKNIKNSKKLYIEAQFYQEGARVFEFETADLNW